MKKILSLVMVVAMLVAVLALVGCTDKNKGDSSSSSSSSSSSTSSSSENTTASTEEDTTASTEDTTASTEDTTASTEDTTASTEDTTASTEDTTASTEDTTVSTEDTTASSESETTESTTETTLPPVFARFDFGTDSKAQSLGMTSHDYLVEILTFNAEFINVTYTEDSIIVTAVKDHPEVTFDAETGAELFNGYAIDSYALCYEDIITYDFDDCLTKTESFMRVRIKNQSTNNIMGIRWHHGSNAYATTMLASCMYLQGGAPTIEDYIAGETKKTCEASDVYKTYTYDINFCAALARHGDRGEVYGNSYVHMAYYVGLGHGTGSNNWNWMGANECSSIQFLVLGAYGGRPTSGRLHYGYADTRANIVEGATVEIDYILFGASKANLNTFTSNIEDASVSESISVSVVESISASVSASISESEAAATATTAAA